MQIQALLFLLMTLIRSDCFALCFLKRQMRTPDTFDQIRSSNCIHTWQQLKMLNERSSFTKRHDLALKLEISKNLSACVCSVMKELMSFSDNNDLGLIQERVPFNTHFCRDGEI